MSKSDRLLIKLVKLVWSKKCECFIKARKLLSRNRLSLYFFDCFWCRTELNPNVCTIYYYANPPKTFLFVDHHQIIMQAYHAVLNDFLSCVNSFIHDSRILWHLCAPLGPRQRINICTKTSIIFILKISVEKFPIIV